MKPYYAECRNCGERIVFEPFWRDGREPNPPIWWHPPGGRTCARRPADWPNDSWPKAEPRSDHD